MATNYVSVRDYGAKGDGRTDDGAALQKAFNAAASSGKDVYIPAGTYLHSNQISANGINVYGDGDTSVLKGTAPKTQAIRLTGDGAELHDVKLTSTATSRLSNAESAGVHVEKATNFVVDDVTIDNAGSAGMIIRLSSNGKITDNTVMNTKADSIHMTRASHDIVVDGNTVKNSGDDGIAVVSYKGQEDVVKNITVTDNTVLDNLWGRNLSVVGGDNVKMIGNLVDGNKAGLAGVYISGETSYNTYGATNVLVDNNVIKNTGSQKTGHGEVMVYNNSSNLSDKITVSHNNIVDYDYQGIKVTGAGNRHVVLDDNNIGGTSSNSIVVVDGSQSYVTKTANELVSATYSGPTGSPYAGSAPAAPTTPTAPATPTTPSSPDTLSTKIVVNASGTAVGSTNAHFNVLLDGKKIGDATASTSSKDFSFNANVTADQAHKVQIQYDNDTSSSTQDRNLFVNKITINGHAVSPTDSMVSYDRGALDGKDVIKGQTSMWWEGALTVSADKSFFATAATAKAALAAPVGDLDAYNNTVLWHDAASTATTASTASVATASAATTATEHTVDYAHDTTTTHHDDLSHLAA